MQLEVGTVLEGRVTGITNFGAFVSLPGGKSGLVHISEVANTYVKDVHDHLSEGQAVRVKVLRLTPEGKINLSIKAVESPPSAPPVETHRAPVGRSRPAPVRAPEGQVAPRTSDAVFEDKLKHFMQESDSKISGARIYENQRRGSRRRR